MEQIKNIIFDVGDVLLSYRWKYMLMDYGLSEEEAVRIGTEMFDCGDCLIWEPSRSRRSLSVIVENIRQMKR
jgi:hypothetical protein